MRRVSAGIIIEGDEILLARRARLQKQAGYWEFPGGKQEPNETIQACLERELREELGVASCAGAVFDVSVYKYEGGVIKLIGVLATLADKKFELSVHDQVKWIPISKLLDFRLAPADIPIAAKIKRIYGESACTQEAKMGR